jgi:hypothetical protein
MPEITNALRSARAAIEHPQCGQILQTAVATESRPFGDREALAILLAIPRIPVASMQEVEEAKGLLTLWESKCSHWLNDQTNGHNAMPLLPRNLGHWQPYLVAAERERNTE